MRLSTGVAASADVTDRTARDLGFVREFWYNEIRNSRGFVRGDISGPTAGQYSHVQLLNPGGSGITIVIRRIVVSGPTASQIAVRTYNTALATLVSAGANYNAGAAAATGVVRKEDNVAILGSPILFHRMGADRPCEVVSAWAWQLGAGEGVLLNAEVTNIAVYVSYEWVEF